MPQTPTNETPLNKSMSQDKNSNALDSESSFEIVSSKNQALMPLSNQIQASNYFEEHKNRESLSDEETDVTQLLLTPVESKLKTIIWIKMHKDWIEKQKLKLGIFTQYN